MLYCHSHNNFHIVFAGNRAVRCQFQQNFNTGGNEGKCIKHAMIPLSQPTVPYTHKTREINTLKLFTYAGLKSTLTVSTKQSSTVLQSQRF